MNKTNDGGPAFPGLRRHVSDNCFEPISEGGMTLRDWFAGQERIDNEEDFGWPLLEALAGPRPSGTSGSNPLEWFHWSNTWQAKVRWARADAMLAAREGGAK